MGTPPEKNKEKQPKVLRTLHTGKKKKKKTLPHDARVPDLTQNLPRRHQLTHPSSSSSSINAGSSPVTRQSPPPRPAPALLRSPAAPHRVLRRPRCRRHWRGSPSAARPTAGTNQPGVNMLHHSNSRNQRNRGSRVKTLLQATLLLGVIFWLLYQVKHSFDKKSEYLDDAEDQLANNDRSMFQGRKEKAGSYMVGDNSDLTTKPEDGAVDHHSDTFDHNENTGETVFDKDSTNLHEDDKRNTERSEAEEGQVNSADGNTEANNNNNEDETTGHAEEGKHDTESNSASESKSEVNSTGDDMPNHAQEENIGEASGTSHDEVVQGDESTSASGSGNGSDGEGEKKEAVDTQSGSESLPDVAKAEATDDRATGSLPDETGNIPSVHTDNSQNDGSENQGDATSTTSDSSEHGTGEAVHIETGLEDESATGSSGGTGSGDDKGNSSDSTSAEENTETASGDVDKGMETGTTTEGSHPKEENSENSSVSTEAENSQGDSSSGVNDFSEETSNKGDGATETSKNGEQVDPKIETSTSTNDEHNESQGADSSSGSNDSNDNGPEQTGKTESQ